MVRALAFPIAMLVVAASSVAAQNKPAERQIAEAVSALPAPMRDGAGVLGYRDGALVTLRGGSNGMECLADNPAEEGLHVACYHESLARFMARGRALRADGKNTTEIKAMREAEIKAGALPMPERAAALYSITGDDDAFDSTTGETRGSGLYVLYVPYATEATLGVSTRPAVDRPWLMEPGKPWAHVMIRR